MSMEDMALVRDMLDERGSTEVDKAIGWSDRYRRSYLNTPGVAARAKWSTRLQIARAAKRLRPFPLPNHLLLLREKLVHLKAYPGSDELEDLLIIAYGFLQNSKPSTPF